jgi:glycosyltransferase involved in cell wall biosynthesis
LRAIERGLDDLRAFCDLRNSALFDAAYYLEQNPDARDCRLDPLVHYVMFGASEGRDPHPLFSSSWYGSQPPNAPPVRGNPLADYLRSKGRATSPHPLFDTAHYLGQRPPVPLGSTPLEHYLSSASADECHDPHPLFSSMYYLTYNPDVLQAQLNPLLHFVRWGGAEGRNPHPYFATTPYSVRDRPDALQFLIGADPHAAAIKDWLQWRIDRSRDTPAAAESIAREGPSDLLGCRITILSGYPETPSEAYRVTRLADALRAQGVTVIVASASDLSRVVGERSQPDVLVLFRVALNQPLALFVHEIRANGCSVVFDVDDYVFEPTIAHEGVIDGIRVLSADDKALYRPFVVATRRALALADFCTTSTHYLAERIREAGKPAYVIPNCFDDNALARAEVARARTHPSDAIVRLGYASGTLTHQKDFAVAAEAIARVLRSHSNARLTVVGQLLLSEFPCLASLSHQIEHRPSVPFNALPEELARFDVNLAPLEIGNPFCEAKSEIKFIDAALLNVPTVASATDTFRRVIRTGENGYLSVTADDWVDALTRLIADPDLRVRLGAAAHMDALTGYGSDVHRRAALGAYGVVVRERQVPAGVSSAGPYQSLRFSTDLPPVALVPPTTVLRPDCLKLHWIIPQVTVGSGGHMNVFRMISYLERWGHRNTVWIHSLDRASNRADHRAVVSRHFLPLTSDIRSLPDDLGRLEGDAVIATDYRSAYFARAAARFRRRFYFLQDYETAFHPQGTEALLAENTYRFGFDALSNGAWLHDMAQRRYGMWSAVWEQAADERAYFSAPSRKVSPQRIAFYARHTTPRRAVELGFLALDILQERNAQPVVDFFGCEWLPFEPTYRHHVHGILAAPELGELYRQGTLGMCFSATNSSIVPREMLACGLPVIELDSECNRMMFPDTCVRLVPPDPWQIADIIGALLANHQHLAEMSEDATSYSRRFNWELSAHSVELALRQRLVT